MLTLDPEFRPSASEVLRHKWFDLDFDLLKEIELTEVIDDLDKRKSLKSNGKLSICLTLNVGSIDEEILKKGLEISSLKYTKSMGCSNGDYNLNYFNEDRKILDK